jgi:glycerol-3-phosphate acyltransferase PlsX
LTISIAIDAMGGDRAPAEVVRGAVLAARESPDLHLFLVGREKEVRDELERAEWRGDSIEVVAAENVIGMGDSPVEALRKKRGSSIEVATRLVREGRAAAFVSAGNTGACVAAASLFIGLLKAVKRPGIAVVFYTAKNPVTLIDVGANVYSKPEHLVQYGLMASIYSRDILGVENPRVGLLNVGEEDEKGSALAKTSHSLFQSARVNFIGNIEGADIFSGDVQVVVCDGFVGNIVLKVSEGLAEKLMQHASQTIKEAIATLPNSLEIGMALKRAFGSLQKRIDYSEYGGAPLLGVNGSVIISHGRSDAKAISNAIGVAKRMAANDLASRMAEVLEVH